MPEDFYFPNESIKIAYNRVMNYDIIATLGPASISESSWSSLLTAGAAGFRLNTSHLSLDELDEWMARYRSFYKQLQEPAPVILDLQGSKWRLGQIKINQLQTGQKVRLVQAAQVDHPDVLPVPHADFFTAAPDSGSEIVLNDGKVRLVVVSINQEELVTRVTVGGPIASRKGITFINSNYRLEALSEKDRVIFERTRTDGFVRYAISYVKDVEEMRVYRSIFGPGAHLIAKLERRPAVDQVEQIAAFSNALWLCRGDLGAEIGLQSMAETALRISRQVSNLHIPVLLAGQVLEHMTGSPQPTRSEVYVIYDALQHGYRGFVLSDETAVGKYPVESVRSAGMFR